MALLFKRGISMLHGSNHRFISWDGVQLSYRAWMSSHAQPRRAMIMLHAEGFNADGWQSLAGEMVSADLAVFAWDARGHGHSPGIRGYISHTAILIKDLDAFMRHLTTKFQFDK